MNFRFHPDAEEELSDAVEYYDDKANGLGREFALEVYATVLRSAAFPKTWPVLEGRVRRSLVRRFPYAVLYAESGGGIFVLAVMHQRRKPGYWKNRQVASS